MSRSTAAIVGIFVAGCATAGSLEAQQATVLPIAEQWHGDYPVSELRRLPESQRRSEVGYLGDAGSFASVWQVFQPGTPVPKLDFRRHVVLFARNVDFYNQIHIAKVSLNQDGGVEMLASETLSAMPIEEKVAMAFAVIPRAGLQYLQTRTERIPVVSGTPAPAAGATGS